MKVLLLLPFLFTIGLSFGQNRNPWKGKPTSIAESFLYLDKILDDTTKYTFMTLPEDIATSRLHHGFGTWMRNNWGLWRSGSLKKELLDSGFVHPDDMSSVLLKAYHRKLNNKPLQLQVEAKAYRAYWSKHSENGLSADDVGNHQIQLTTPQELLSYFPVGDTILVSIYATHKKLFHQYASGVKGLAVVQSHLADKLQVKLLWVEQKKKHEPDHGIGEEFDVSPIYCSLIPPKGWTIHANER